jgi:hypothetical protein
VQLIGRCEDGRRQNQITGRGFHQKNYPLSVFWDKKEEEEEEIDGSFGWG